MTPLTLPSPTERRPRRPARRAAPATGRAWLWVLPLAAFFFGFPGGPLAAAPPGAVPIAVAFPEAAEKSHVLLVEKSTQTLTVLRHDGGWRPVAVYPCSTGKANGDKRAAGDMKTPEGVYFFTDHHLDGDLSPIYGTRAFPLNYPNALDRDAGKSGSAIWLHGTDRPLAPYDSNGCVAMANGDIDRLAAVIDLRRTPILLTEHARLMDSEAAEALHRRVALFLEDWRKRLAEGSYQRYLDLYDPEYLPPIDWWRDWRALRRRAGPSWALRLADLSVVRHGEVFVAAFDQTIVRGERRIPAGRRLLYLRGGAQAMRIVGDEYHRVDGDGWGPVEATPLTAAAARLSGEAYERDRIDQFVQRWIGAWQGRDIEAYGACYDAAFRSGNMNKSQWLRYKQSLNRKYARIAVSADHLSIRVDGDAAVVTFTQRYASDRYRSEGRKTLRLRREKDQWKIFREIFSGR